MTRYMPEIYQDYSSPETEQPSSCPAPAEQDSGSGLALERKSAWLSTTDSQSAEIFAYADEYKTFLSTSKTERTCIQTIIENLVSKGFKSLDAVENINPGDRLYRNIKGKSLIAMVAGRNPEKLRFIGSHVDSPRLDLKPNPLYEDSEMALMKTHYYGGIKKYHWVNIPLELCGIIYTRQGRRVQISIGGRDEDPVFIIPDLLPHLQKEQMKREASRVIEGEELNVIFGHVPLEGKEIKQRIKEAVMERLNREYGIVEEDFNCAELEFVPALRPRDIGLDRSLVGAYGQDDRVCAFASLKALMDISEPEFTAVTYFADKEEIGSSGDTGAESFALPAFIETYILKAGLRCGPFELLRKAAAISADVIVGVDPNFKSANDPQNSSYLGKGVTMQKYGGHGGKYSTNDAHAEYLSHIRRLLTENDIPWQTGEFGKVDVGGGGTIAQLLSRYGMDCVDAGPAMLGMHSICELTSKVDIYSSYRLYKAFYLDTRDPQELYQ